MHTTSSSTAASHAGAHGRTGPGGAGRVGAQHTHSRTKLRTAERDHVLSNMSSHNLAVLWAGMSQNILNQIVSILVTGNVDERNAGSVGTALADSIQVASEELRSSNLEALLDDLGRKLIRAVLGRITNHMIDSAAAVGRGTVLADVLDAPIAELAVGNNVNVREDFLNAGTLAECKVLEIAQLQGSYVSSNKRTLSSSRQFSKMFWTTRLPVSPRATSCHIPLRASLTYFII